MERKVIPTKEKSLQNNRTSRTVYNFLANIYPFAHNSKRSHARTPLLACEIPMKSKISWAIVSSHQFNCAPNPKNHGKINEMKKKTRLFII